MLRLTKTLYDIQGILQCHQDIIEANMVGLSPKFTLTNLITAGYPNSGNTTTDQKLYIFLLGKEKLKDFREHC